MKNAVTTMLICLFLSACVEVTDLNEQGPATNEMHYQVLERSEPNQYSVVIPLEPGEVAFRKAADISTAIVAVAQPLAGPQLVDERVEGGQRYIYQIGSIQSGSLIVNRTVSVFIPKDRVFVSGDQSLTAGDLASGTEYGRVYFAKGSRVRTNGADWRLHANRIISDGGTIYSFPEGQTANVGENGRSGGSLRVSVQDLIGVLDIDLRGENGGIGSSGDEPAERGQKGIAGIPGKGLPQHCVKSAVSPGDGAPGLIPGGKGHDGGRGGDAGDFYLFVAGEISGGVNVRFYPGQGGVGGAGGLGQRGGEPGDFDRRKNPASCGYRKAHEGPRGPQGEQGSSGLPGLRGKVCRQIGKKLNCRQGT